jgi:hypothetical protein
MMTGAGGGVVVAAAGVVAPGYAAGWVNLGGCGCALKGRRFSYSSLVDLATLLQSEGVIPQSIKNFSRFDQAAKRVCLAAGLCLYDAGISADAQHKINSGLVASGPGGVLETNTAYFNDYLQAGRTMARGNLFIYTLPTSPLAETAIHFGLCGPLIYLNAASRQQEAVLEDAGRICSEFAAAAMLAVYSDEGSAVCHFIKGKN